MADRCAPRHRLRISRPYRRNCRQYAVIAALTTAAGLSRRADDGGMPAVGALVRCTDGSWMTRPPQNCSAGHRLEPGRMLVVVGHQPCAGLSPHAAITRVQAVSRIASTRLARLGKLATTGLGLQALPYVK